MRGGIAVGLATVAALPDHHPLRGDDDGAHRDVVVGRSGPREGERADHGGVEDGVGAHGTKLRRARQGAAVT